jgi:hypothetical protein
MVPADIPDHRFTLKSSFAIYIYMSSAASRTAFFLIAFFAGFLFSALSTALLTEFLTTLLEVFFTYGLVDCFLELFSRHFSRTARFRHLSVLCAPRAWGGPPTWMRFSVEFCFA